MTTIVPYRPEHLLRLALQESQQYLAKLITPDYAEALAGLDAYTALDGDEILGCAGVVPMWENRAVLWAYLSPDIGPRFSRIHRAARRFVEGLPYRRLELTVDEGFEQGHRWARLFGFTLECERMRAYRPDGGDSSMYVRIR